MATRQHERESESQVSVGQARRDVEERRGRSQGGESRGIASRRDPFGEGLFGATPFTFLRRFAEDIDSLFEEFRLMPAGRGEGGRSMMGDWNPAVELETRGSELVVRAELPGVKREDIRIDLEDDVLCIAGERRQQRESREGGQWRSERHYGSFCRRLALPGGIDPDRCQARFEDGVLEITIPMSEQPRGRRIAVTGPEETAGAASERRGQREEGTGAPQQH